MSLTLEELRRRVSYDPETGIFWRLGGYRLPSQHIGRGLMTRDQIDPFSTQIVDCKASLIAMMADNILWHLNRLEKEGDRLKVLEKVSERLSEIAQEP